MPRFRIKHALGGGFGGIKNEDWQLIESDSQRSAMEEARRLAIDEYQSMEGMHGLRSISQIMEEDGLNEQEAESEYNEEMESWLDFIAEPISDDGELEEDDDDV